MGLDMIFQHGTLGPLVRPCRRPNHQKARTSRVRRVLYAAAIDAAEAGAGVTATSGVGVHTKSNAYPIPDRN
jgi:hypothetical protein